MPATMIIIEILRKFQYQEICRHFKLYLILKNNYEFFVLYFRA